MSKINSIKIGKKLIGPGYSPYIIFEVASTHENDWETAEKYVIQAKESGADAIKFQLFQANKLINPILPSLKPTYDYLKRAETPRTWFPKLKKLCDKVGIDLLCTPFDIDSAIFLNDLGIPAIKIASGDITYHKLLKLVAGFGKPVILSTGASTIHEIEKAVKILRKSGCKDIVLLQCVSVYPMPYKLANIRVMETYRKKFNAVVGYSDNGSRGALVPLVASSWGASVIEKHVTAKKERGHLDDIFSMTVEEYTEMVKKIRINPNIEKLRKEFGNDVDIVLGDGVKKPTSLKVKRLEEEEEMTEIKERVFVRRAIYPKKNILKGAKIKSDMIIALRPSIGISASEWDKVLDKIAAENLKARKPLKLIDKKVYLLKKHEVDLQVEFYATENNQRLLANYFDAIVVLCAEETDVGGENGERIKIGLSLTRKLKTSLFIFLGTKTHNRNLKKYLESKKYLFEVIYVSSWRKHASTWTEIKDFSDYLAKNPIKRILIVTHAYHIPRVKRYCEKHLPKTIDYDFWPIGSIENQQKQVEKEIKKIIKYQAKGHL